MSAVALSKDTYRRALIAKVKVGQKALGLDEDSYRDLLERETGRRSAGDCSLDQLRTVVARMVLLGFQPTTARNPQPGRYARASNLGGARRADSAVARKARALWISLHQLGVIDNPSEQALEAFGRRQLGVAKLQWADASHSDGLIEALKAMAERAGWSQDVRGVPAKERGAVLQARLEALVKAR